MTKKSTKYQLLYDDYQHVCKQLKLSNELVNKQREDIERLENQVKSLSLYNQSLGQWI